MFNLMFINIIHMFESKINNRHNQSVDSSASVQASSSRNTIER